MKNGIQFLMIVFLLTGHVLLKAQKTITFLSKDDVIITADIYLVNETLPYMILCHQEGYSRGEYSETAPKLNKFRYNCIAIDARAGSEINNKRNETAFRAKAKNKPTSYSDAEQDILAAIDYAYKQSKQKVILIGSSYSASLAMKIGTTNDKVKAVIAFSPGGDFAKEINLKELIKNYNKPIFVTSSKAEAPSVSSFIKDIKSQKKEQFIPSGKGAHGSSALWKGNSTYHEYWLALMMFMQEVR